MKVSPGSIKDHMDRTLPIARERYGNKNQIIVAMEELNELSCILAKFCRYDNEEKAIEETKQKVTSEIADVLIVLEHVHAIFSIDPDELRSHMKQKLTRLDGWLEKSDSIEQTTIDRDLKPVEQYTPFNPCEGCVGEYKSFSEEPCKGCTLRQNLIYR